MEKKVDLPERTFAFALRIIELCKSLDQKPGTLWTLSRQLLRAGTSIGANVEESQAGQSKADFISKLSIACKEARETLYWLRLLASSSTIKESRLVPLMDECNQLVAILTAITGNAKRNLKQCILRYQ